MLHNLPLYFLAVLTISLLPGPDMLYIISQSISHGKRLGIAAALGIGSGCFVHIFAITIGLSSIIFKSALAFSIIKYVGACYLLYLGITSFTQKSSAVMQETDDKLLKITSWKKVYAQGFLTNVLNPKVALFFLAFLPQFVSASSNYSIGMQLLILGLIFNFSGTTVNLFVAYFFGSAKKWLAANPVALKIQQKITGFILVGLGLRLAASGRSV
jgi:threonine/homoserine/homoserine lactone efflux protein